MPGHFTFYTDKIDQGFADFDESESNHMSKVLRFGVGDVIAFTDGTGRKFQSEIVQVSKRGVRTRIQSSIQEDAPTFILGVGILKSSDRMEWLVEKAVEIGMKKMIFLHCKNSERSKISLDKLKKVAIAAMKQSHGSWLPDFEVYNFSEALEIYGGGAFIAHCEIGAKEELSSLKRDSVVFIGPEGDFASDEIELARVKGLKELNLGSRILRTETAGLAACLSANLLG